MIGGLARYPGHVEAFVKSYGARNFWRVDGYMEFEDVMGEGYLLFLEIRNRLRNVTPAEFMAYFQKSWIHRIDRLSDAASKARKEEVHEDWELGTNNGHGGDFLIKIAEAPKPVKDVLNFLMFASPQARSGLIRKAKNRRIRIDEGSNRYLCLALGYDPHQVNLVKLFHDYFD